MISDSGIILLTFITSRKLFIMLPILRKMAIIVASVPTRAVKKAAATNVLPVSRARKATRARRVAAARAKANALR